MTREQLEHIIRAVADITGRPRLVVIGSQAILGQFPNAPAELLISREADIYAPESPELSELITGSIGERAHREGDHDVVGGDVAAELRRVRGGKPRWRTGTEHERVGVQGGSDRRGGHRRERGRGVGRIGRWEERCVARPVRRREDHCLASVCPGTHGFCAGWAPESDLRDHGRNGKR